VDLGLNGKVAVVTGASRGIGWATAALLMAEGAKVLGVSRTPLDRELPGLEHVLADMTDDSTPSLVADRALSSFGHIDVLVNNAGSGRIRTGYMDVTDEQWREGWELLFLSVVRMTNSALPSLLASGSGVVVNVSSYNARVPVPSVPDYAAAKAALNNYSKGLAGQYAKQGMRVVTVSPGPTATPLWLGPEGAAVQYAAQRPGADPDAIVRQAEESMPHSRLVKAEEVADLIVYLASARAGSVSGIDILIEAGLTQTL
jgi:NAD(P)-dependent dehydrogenase (short-subunit alcohol dehydrogenase family)